MTLSDFSQDLMAIMKGVSMSGLGSKVVGFKMAGLRNTILGESSKSP